MKDRLEEYVDGLLSAEERSGVEEALARDPELRAELERVRRFARVLEEMDPDVLAVRRAVERERAVARRRGLLRRLAVLAAAAAVILALWPRSRPDHESAVLARIEEESLAFGRRLGAIATERRQGRVPRAGVGDLEVPPAAAYGIVFAGALEELEIRLPEGASQRVKDLVMRHHLAHAGARGIREESERAAAALALYRDLEDVAGERVADAYYDVFRPGLADSETARRVGPGSLAFVLENHERYRAAYRAALAELGRTYGERQVALVVDYLAPRDRRTLWQDAAQEGVGRGAVLDIRAKLYRAAAEAGADRLYVEG